MGIGLDHKNDHKNGQSQGLEITMPPVNKYQKWKEHDKIKIAKFKVPDG